MTEVLIWLVGLLTGAGVVNALWRSTFNKHVDFTNQTIAGIKAAHERELRPLRELSDGICKQLRDRREV